MQRTTIFLTDAQRADLELLRQQTGMSVAEHIRRAIDKHLKSAVIQDAMRAAKRRADGVPFHPIDQIERSLFLRLAPIEVQRQVAAAKDEEERRRILDAYYATLPGVETNED